MNQTSKVLEPEPDLRCRAESRENSFEPRKDLTPALHHEREVRPGQLHLSVSRLPAATAARLVASTGL